MAWTAPMTAVSGAVFTANQYNTYIRDNLLETGVASVTGANQILAVTGTNSVSARSPAADTVATSQTTTSTTFTDLTTAGPTVTVDTGAYALVMISSYLDNSSANAATSMSYEISGASTATASSTWAITRDGQSAATNGSRFGSVVLWDNLNPGTNTFTAKYNVVSGTGTFFDRTLVVVPF